MMKMLTSTPRQDGFNMPAEYAQHEGCWIFWPERIDSWRNDAIPAQQVFAKIAATIAEFELVTVAVSPMQFKRARNLLPSSVRLVELSYNDSWTRDIAPTFVTNGRGQIRGIDWQFNAWGGLYVPYDLDDEAARKILEFEHIDGYRANFVLEGGAINTDGEGTLLTTEECLLDENRNPGLSKSQMEENLKEYLGVDKVIWLSRGLCDDETKGHIDNLCCFVRPSVVALNWTEDKNDPQYEICQQALNILSSEQDAKGRSLVVHKICQPNPLRLTREECEGVETSANIVQYKVGDRLTASYINFYIANSAIIAPLFDDDNHDQNALALLKELFPERKIIGIQAREVLLGGGGIHCITQQQPQR